MKNRIKEFRRKLGINQLDLARKVGVRRETILYLEKGKYNPSLKLAFEISRMFDVPIEEIFINEDSGDDSA